MMIGEIGCRRSGGHDDDATTSTVNDFDLRHWLTTEETSRRTGLRDKTSTDYDDIYRPTWCCLSGRGVATSTTRLLYPVLWYLKNRQRRITDLFCWNSVIELIIICTTFARV